MPQAQLDALNILTTPVWVVSPQNQDILFANTAAQTLTGDHPLTRLRHGRFSAHAQHSLASYLPALRKHEQIVEIWTLAREGHDFPLSCHLSLTEFGEQGTAIVVEGINASGVVMPVAPSSQEPLPITPYRRDERGFYQRLFQTNTAPMLLINPAAEGQIVDANQAATRFYGYSREQMCEKHTWEINAMGRDVLPVMHEIARLPGGAGRRAADAVHYSRHYRTKAAGTGAGTCGPA